MDSDSYDCNQNNVVTYMSDSSTSSTNSTSSRTISSIALVFLLVISSMMFISPATQAQPTGVQTIILRPTGDDLRDWDIPAAISGWVNITPTGDEYFQTTWEDEGTGALVYLASGDSYQAAWRVLTATIPVGSVLEEVHIVFWEYGHLGYTTNYDFAFYTVLEGTALLVNIGDSTNTNKHYERGTSLGYFTDGGTANARHNYSLPIAALESQRTSYSEMYFACTNTTETPYWTAISSLENTTAGNRPFVWVKYAGGDHYAQLDETTSGGDGLTSYVATITAPEYDRFSMSNVPVGCSGLVKSITSVQVWSLEAMDSGSGNANIRFGVYIGSTYYEGDTYSPTTSFVNRTKTWTTNPATTSAWTLSEVQALVIYLHTTDAAPRPLVTQMGVLITVNYGWASTFTSTPTSAPHSGYWYPSDAYSYVITTNSSSTLVNDLKATWQTFTTGNSTLWGRIPLTQVTATIFIVTHATSTNGKQCSWQNYSFNIVNTAPSFTSSPVLSVNAITSYYYDANATDENGITYSLNTNWTGSASALAIVPSTGVVTATAPHTIGWYNVDVIAFDGLYYTYQSFSVNITYVTSFFTSTPITTIHWNTNYHYDAQVTSSYTITFGMVTNWTGATISSDTGEVNRTAPHSLGWYYVDVNFTDGFAVYWQNYSVNVTNTDPYFTSSPLTTIHWSVSYSYQAIATSGDIDSLTFALVSDWASVTCSPSGLVENTQPFTVGSYYVNVSVTDGLATIYQNYSVSVTNIDPAFTSTPILSWVFLKNYSYDANAVSGDIDTLTFGLVTNFSGASIVPATGVVTNTNPFSLGSYYLNVSVTDGYIYVYQNITLAITPGWAPTFTSTPVTLVYVNSSYVYVVIWNETVLSHSMTTNASWLTWYPGIHSILGNSPSNGSYWVNITATSTNGYLVSWQNYTVFVTGVAPAGGIAIGPLESTTLAFIFGFGLIGMAFVMRDKKYIFITLAGLVWILSGVLVFPDYDAGWVILSIAFGISLLYEGATGLMEMKK